ncbi:putative BRO1 domain, ALIX V-shaped domain, BRO1 domain superfamily protein [Helianthus annuus]|uniref:BRO1 domain, ALIX V-shaped domain, BRO1 domain superfamily protein n=1 Tax=Helianthus annuus TaxID=4232 RepID=A0A9K3DNW4_HELAN|nr:putative BRO1 domain, ALIX V-shaped domain, BRO1 domain superfamily protein [Helianthus annuus]
MSSTSPSSSSNIMLAIYEKKTTAIDLYRPLRNYVAFNYSEREAQNLDDDLETLKSMRNSIERSSAVDSLTSRRDLLQNYFKTLTVIESRFPISDSNDDVTSVTSVTFTWHDAFKHKQKASQQSIHLEKAAVLFNLGAVYSQLGLGFDRMTVEGRRQASHAFIAAAGAFAFLRENESVKASVGSSTTVDVSVECVGMLERLMLAQAQECVFENSIAKGSSNGVCSKIARQVGLYYEEALAALNVAPLAQHFDKAWLSHVQLKAALFYAEACYRYSLELHEKEEIGEEIARLKSGIGALTDAKKSSPKGAAQQILDAVNKLETDLKNNLDRAMKENDRVYLMRVPPASALQPLPAFAMVKPLNMSEVLDASKEKMFASLVPDSSAKALSRYTEMVDDIIRTQAEKLQQGSELARVSLKEMDLPGSILALEGHSVLPTALWEDVEAVQVSGGPAGLESELQQLRDLSRVNHELLVQTEELIQKEAAEDAQFRSQFGTRWTRPQSNTLTKNLQDRLNRFAANLKQAADSDAKIERSVRENMSLMSILDRRPIESALPTLSKPIMSLDANEDAIVGTLKQSLRQLETLGAQRAGLEDMLKDMKRKDDILPKLMTSAGSYEDLFRKEIAKYDHICEEISQNLQAQEQLLLHIQAQNGEFAATFNVEDYRAACEKCYKQIEAAIAKYREIKDNINEGLKFYDAITSVKQQCSDFVMTRSIQCRDMIEDVQKQMSGLSFQDGKNSSAYNYSSTGPPQRPSSQSEPPTNQPRPQTPYYHQPSPPAYAQQHPSPPAYAQQHPSPSAYAPQHPTPPAYAQQHPTRPVATSEYSQQPAYSRPQPPPPYYNGSPSPYPPQQGQQPPAAGGYEYGQPAYPGWQGSYYNAQVQGQQGQQPGSFPRPPYTVPSPYPPNQSGYYNKQ